MWYKATERRCICNTSSEVNTVTLLKWIGYNYLAYGLGATTAWVFGIPHGFAVMHGKTRRGALVFDIADIVKDALVLPLAFICASENLSEQEFRQECLNYFTAYGALDEMFEVVKRLALKTDWN